jgi:hypothetical protein
LDLLIASASPSGDGFGLTTASFQSLSQPTTGGIFWLKGQFRLCWLKILKISKLWLWLTAAPKKISWERLSVWQMTESGSSG